MQDIKNLTLINLERFLIEKGHSAFRARQIFSWIYQKRNEDFALMTNLSQALKELLRANLYFSKIELIDKFRSEDKTEKFLFRLEDNNSIESVIIPVDKRITFCISTQVGCKYKCLFCASGKSGFIRNLTSGEIVSQILYLKDYRKDLGNIVFMGIGEPLDNYDNLLLAIRIINDKNGLNIGARKITISTCGLIPQINKLANEKLQVELSVSLHAASDKIREKLMPVNKIYPLEKLIAACKDYYKNTNRQITFEYVLIKDINSSLQDAKNLAKILKGFDAKINLIVYNMIPGFGLIPPDKKEISSFFNQLKNRGVNVTVRRPRGQDIEAACGQLKLIYEK
ncbi:MAG: 23S rRNA (adenine(2503)-C(2))-methyltransferase RlmN [Candidatus Omnitrophota bacterium]